MQDRILKIRALASLVVDPVVQTKLRKDKKKQEIKTSLCRDARSTYTESGDETSQYSALVVVFLNRVPAMGIKFSKPPPTPEFLTKDFPSATKSQMEILTKENLIGEKAAPTAYFRTFT